MSALCCIWILMRPWHTLGTDGAISRLGRRRSWRIPGTTSRWPRERRQRTRLAQRTRLWNSPLRTINQSPTKDEFFCSVPTNIELGGTGILVWAGETTCPTWKCRRFQGDMKAQCFLPGRTPFRLPRRWQLRLMRLRGDRTRLCPALKSKPHTRRRSCYANGHCHSEPEDHPYFQL